MYRWAKWIFDATIFGSLLLMVLKGDAVQNQPRVEPSQTESGMSAESVRPGETEPTQESAPSRTPSASLDHPADPRSQTAIPPSKEMRSLETVTLGGGCFWCLEAVFQQLRGVRKVRSGYSGGHLKNPTYDQVCTGTTGHAEVVQIQFDPRLISCAELLEVFFTIHDPTTLNRQGNDIGPQYRSVIFYHTPEQRQTAVRIQQQLERTGSFLGPIVTEIVPFKAFYPAEDAHQDYYRRNSTQPYCRGVIGPKLEKFRKTFPQKVQTPSSETPSGNTRP